MVVLDCENTRKLEQEAVAEGKTYRELMEQAGVSATRFIKKRLKGSLSNPVILCGNGNNAGDGFVVARELCSQADIISVILTNGQPRTEAAKYMYEKILDIPNIIIMEYDDEDAEVAVSHASLIVDSIFGIGFKGKIREKYESFFDMVNSSPAKKVALDLPSGLECDSSKVLGKCIKADYTVTFSTLKPSQLLYPSAEYCGEVVVKSVGISHSLIEGSKKIAKITGNKDINSFFVKRESNAHKGSIGKLFSVCGSYSMAGAAQLSAEAALRSGAGLVCLALPKSIYPIVASQVPECIYKPMQENSTGSICKSCKEILLREANSANACLIGCGLSNNEDTAEIVCHLIRNSEVPLIVDADGINIISENINVLREAKAEIILTPHPREMSRLVGKSIQDVLGNRIEIAKELSSKTGAVVLLKGANTVAASPDGRVRINRTGNPGMATGGSGDVLAGIIASFVAQGKGCFESACMGAFVHGLSGDVCANKYSRISMLPCDIVDNLYVVFRQIERDYLGYL